MRAATLLGHEMARRETGLVPLTLNAAFYANYAGFRSAHRDLIERSGLFTKWHERLLELAEREGQHLRPRSSGGITTTDWYNSIVYPMRQQLWLAWEAWHDLPSLYHKMRAELPPPEPLGLRGEHPAAAPARSTAVPAPCADTPAPFTAAPAQLIAAPGPGSPPPQSLPG